MKEIQRTVSIATIRKVKGAYVPTISHIVGDAWEMKPRDSDAEARALINSIWPGVAWIQPKNFKERLKGERM